MLTLGDIESKLVDIGEQMVAARAEALPEPDPVYNLPPAKRQASITAHFWKQKDNPGSCIVPQTWPKLLVRDQCGS